MKLRIIKLKTLPKLWLLTCAVLALKVGANAQDANDAGTDEQFFELSEFVVTTDRLYGYRANTSVSGTRTATSVRNLPFSLQIVTDELIDDLNVTDLEDALMYTAGVQENRDNVGNFGKFNVRGIQQNYTLRDGFRHYGPNDTAAIAQVEVVKGPAGLLYGQVFPGGVVNAVSKRPLTIDKYELELQYGSYGSYRAELDMGGPLNASKSLSYRLIGSYGDWESFVQYYGRRTKAVVPMLSYKPFDKVKITFEFERYISDEDSPHAGGIAINENDLATAIANPDDPFGIKNGPFNSQVIRSRSFTAIADFLPRWFNTNGPGTFNRYEKYNYALYTDIKFTDWISFRSAAIYADFGQERYANFINNSMRTGVDFFSEAAYAQTNNRVITVQNDFSIELTTGPVDHKILVGYEYYKDGFERYAAAESAPAGSNSRYYVRLPSPYDNITREWSVETRFLNPIGDWAPSPRPENLAAASKTDDRETDGNALYLINQMTLMDERLRLIVGGRYESFESLDAITLRAGAESDLIFQGGAMYNINEALSVFASYSQSFYRNEFFGRTADVALVGQLAPPQEGEGIDIGFKWQTADERFAGTVAYFDLSQSNILVNSTLPDGTPDQVLAGERTSEGLEIDMHIAMTAAWQVIFNYAYIKAKDLESGLEMPNVPKHQASLWTRYEFVDGSLEGLYLGGGVRYLGDRPAGTDANIFEQSWEFDAKGYVHVDVFAGKSFTIAGRQYEVQFNISNLTDKEYIRGGQTLPSEPRRYNLSVKTIW